MVKRDLITHIVLGVLFIVGLIGLRLYVFEPYRIQEADVNRYLAKDELVLAFRTETVKHTDLVLYEKEGKRHVGRVIAMAGDSVTYMDDVFYLNNQVEEEPYLDSFKASHQKQFVNGEPLTADFSIETLTQTVDGVIPKKEFLILNDDRSNTQDSRTYGLIAQDEIVGVISFRLSPLSDFGFVDSI